ncbi:MAG: MurR/RpiR family transcriptional regulator [Filifactoraceae bacterium]
MSIKDEMLEKFCTFSKNEKKVAEFIIKNYDTISHYRGEDIAKSVDTSDTTLFRLTKKLGFSGYIQLKKAISNEQLEGHVRSPYLSLETTPQRDLLKESLLLDIQNFIEGVDKEKLSEVVKMLIDARRVYLFGLGSDAISVQYLNNYLPLCGIPCTLITHQGIYLREMIIDLSEKDVILMSNFPEIEDDEYMFADYANSIGCKIISITDSEITAQKLKSTVFFLTRESRETFYNSPVLSIILSNLILLEIKNEQPEKIRESLKKHHGIVKYMTKK